MMPLPPQFADSQNAVDTKRQSLDLQQGAVLRDMEDRSTYGEGLLDAARQDLHEMQDSKNAFAAGGPAPTQFPETPSLTPDPAQVSQFSTMLMAMAAIGAVGSRGNWTGVASALTGALKGFNEGNQEVAQRDLDQYKMDFAKAKDREAMAHKEFERVLQSRDKTINQKIQEMQVLAAKYQTPDIAQAARMKSLDMMYKQLDARQASLQKLSESHDKWTSELAQRGEAAAAREAERASEMEVRRQIAEETNRTRIGIANQAASQKGWDWFTGKDGKVYRGNKTTGEVEAVEELDNTSKMGGAGGQGSAAQQRMRGVVHQDVSNAYYNLNRLFELGSAEGKLPGGSLVMLGQFRPETFREALELYARIKTTPEGLQKNDALLLNLAFDIASAQSGGTAAISDSKIFELKNQMPLDEMAEDVKRERYAALIHRLDAAQETLPSEMRVDTAPYKTALDFFSLHPGGGERAQRDINADWQGDPVRIRDELNRIHDPTEREQAWAEYRRSENYRDYVTKKYGPK